MTAEPTRTRSGLPGWTAARRWTARRPATVALAVVITVLSVAGFSSQALDWGWNVLSTGQEEMFGEHHWWGVVTAFLAVDGWPSLVTVLPLVLVVVGGAERIMGSTRTIVAYLVGSAVCAFAGFGVSWIETHYLAFVPLNADSVDTLSPATGVICSAMAASSFASALWRRRIRLLATLFALALFLYSGGAGDVFSLLAVPVGLVAGFALGGRRAPIRFVRSSHHETRVLLGSIIALGAVGPIVSAQTGDLQGLLSLYGLLSFDPVSRVDGVACAFGSVTAGCPDPRYDAAQAHSWASLVSFLPLIAVLLAAWGIVRGRRFALEMAVVWNLVLSAEMFLYFGVRPTDIGSLVPRTFEPDSAAEWRFVTSFVVCALLPAAIAVLLFVLRRHVAVRSTDRAVRTAVLTVLVPGAVALLVSCLGLLAVVDELNPRPSAVTVVVDVFLRALPPTFRPSNTLDFVPASPIADVLWYGPSVIIGLALIVATARLLLSPSALTGADDRTRARALLERGGGDTLSFMTTWPGNGYWFDPEADAAVAYRVRGSIAVTTGGPFGPASADPAVVHRFVRFCGDNGWTPAFYGVADGGIDRFAGLHWQRLEVAEEAIVDLPGWSTSGKKWQDVRTSINRMGRAGVVAEWWSWPRLPLARRSQLQAMSETWVADKGLPEMGFTLGGLPEAADPAVRLLLAVDAEGRVQAVTSWLPCYGPDGIAGYTLDLMRRETDGPNGIMEFLIATAAETMRSEGVGFLSLSGAPLARSGGGADADSSVRRLLDYLSTTLEPVYGFRSLLAFKRKFQPRFEPLWLVYPDAMSLPAIGVALARSYLPDLSVVDAARFAREMRAAE